MNEKLLLSAGFKSIQCKDGLFYVIKLTDTDDGVQRLAELCGYKDIVAEVIILQCNHEFTDAVLYIDGQVWHMDDYTFKEIVDALIEV